MKCRNWIWRRTSCCTEERWWPDRSRWSALKMIKRRNNWQTMIIIPSWKYWRSLFVTTSKIISIWLNVSFIILRIFLFFSFSFLSLFDMFLFWFIFIVYFWSIKDISSKGVESEYKGISQEVNQLLGELNTLCIQEVGSTIMDI